MKLLHQLRMSRQFQLPMDEQIRLRRMIAEHLSMISADERARVEQSAAALSIELPTALSAVG